LLELTTRFESIHLWFGLLGKAEQHMRIVWINLPYGTAGRAHESSICRFLLSNYRTAVE